MQCISLATMTPLTELAIALRLLRESWNNVEEYQNNKERSAPKTHSISPLIGGAHDHDRIDRACLTIPRQLNHISNHLSVTPVIARENRSKRCCHVEHDSRHPRAFASVGNTRMIYKCNLEAQP